MWRSIFQKELRQHLTIIPQQPFLFSGSLRENLDPLARKSDAELMDAVKKR
jgi:ABC-type multidrug transport system fused ATPase/permease subunit